MTPEELAWAAGVFEGEGCITVCGGVPSLRMGMTDLDVVTRVRRIFGDVGAIYIEKRGHLGRKDMYRWTVQRRADVVVMMDVLWPWMGERRRGRAAEVMAQYAWLPSGADDIFDAAAEG